MTSRFYIPDGRGLYLVVAPSREGDRKRQTAKPSRERERLTDIQVRKFAKDRTSTYWVLRYMFAKKPREMGLGPYPEIPLKRAREKAAAARTLKADGVDPLENRAAMRLTERLEAARSRTFRDCAETFITEKSPDWRNEKHAKQWRSTLKTYAYPVIGKVPISAVDAPLVKEVLSPIWFAKPETARRVRGRIAEIIDWATNNEYREGENPARRNLFPTSKKAAARRVKHHAALPYKELPAFFGTLQGEEGISALALRFTILTAARTGEVIGATWAEIDFDRALWTVPAARMKGEREHLIPLSAPALARLQSQLEATSGKGYVFPGARQSRPLSNMAMLETLRRMGRSDLTVHGFRSTFKDWASEQTAFPNEVSEAALAHVVGDKVEAAYRRGDLIEKRRKLMNAWGAYCTTKAVRSADVVPIRAVSA